MSTLWFNGSGQIVGNLTTGSMTMCATCPCGVGPTTGFFVRTNGGDLWNWDGATTWVQIPGDYISIRSYNGFLYAIDGFAPHNVKYLDVTGWINTGVTATIYSQLRVANSRIIVIETPPASSSAYFGDTGLLVDGAFGVGVTALYDLCDGTAGGTYAVAVANSTSAVQVSGGGWHDYSPPIGLRTGISCSPRGGLVIADNFTEILAFTGSVWTLIGTFNFDRMSKLGALIGLDLSLGTAWSYAGGSTWLDYSPVPNDVCGIGVIASYTGMATANNGVFKVDSFGGATSIGGPNNGYDIETV